MPSRPPTPLELEARRSATHLVDLIQLASIRSPRLIIAIHEAARAFITEDRRRDLKARIAELDASAIAELHARLTDLERRCRKDATGDAAEDTPEGNDVA